MKNDKKREPLRSWLRRAGLRETQRDKLAQAGYPRFTFRLVASTRAWPESPAEPRRHD
jgi:hypothetical protein